MCRHFAYLGRSVPLRSVLLDPPFGLLRQSWAPRLQRYGTVNADGYGVGWYAAGDERPARYRRPGPIWADADLADLARVVSSHAVLGAVRSATAGCAAGEQAAAPFAAGRWLFSHNGALPGWPRAFAPMAELLPSAELLELEARTDSALLWALVLNRLRAGVKLGEALAEICLVAADLGEARLNLLATDGTSVAATVWGDTLFQRRDADGSVLVASEPFDDGPGWSEIPDRTLLVADAAGSSLTPLAPIGPRTREDAPR
ncbi:ergothioneine biosynthesis protein EgtC [Streptomyces sp. TLI_171]|uniref:ergothioneine biosynthesis protein EgtC n=1 Tax=Streptomyces sp. TLI_171 TaxID=1938859 RepID=UPI000C192315|nr:ergothioneine biosynthesis protein EgtC [Streptomyces sp. TLI_171]RKE22603.1 glutamine amidotransferase [Streptomyces sp. TLI_171]